MDKLCFGTFARALQSALQKPNSNQAVAELLLGLVTITISNEPFTLSSKKVSELFNFKENVPDDIASLASTDKVINTIKWNIQSRVVSCLKPAHIEDMKENLRNIIKNDSIISPIKRNELLTLADEGNESLAEFLSAVYLYVLDRPNKLHRDSEKEHILKVPIDHSIPSMQSIQDTIENIKREQQKTIDDLNMLQKIIAQYEDFTSISVKHNYVSDKSGSRGILKIEPDVLLNYANSHFNDRFTGEAVNRYFTLIRQIIEMIMQTESNLVSAFSGGTVQSSTVISSGDGESHSAQLNVSGNLDNRIYVVAESLYTAQTKLKTALDELYDEERHNREMFDVVMDLPVDFCKE